MSFASLVPDVAWGELLRNVATAAAAYVLALPVGWDREAVARSAGLRTFPLVATASCGFVILGLESSAGDATAMGRALAGLITGIGFIGGGAILKEGGQVRGTATAASLWVTAAVGAAVALNRYELAIVLSLLTFLTLRWVTPMKSVVQDGEPADG